MASNDKETIRSLLRISKKLNSTLDLTVLMSDLVKEAIGVVNAESGLAGLHTLHGMISQTYIHQGTALPLTRSWPSGEGLPGWILQHKVPYVTNKAETDPLLTPELRARFGISTALAIPIINVRDEVLGFIEIHNKKEAGGFTRSDQERLMAISNIAAIAIQNVLTYQESQLAQETQSRLAAIVESSDDAIISKTLEGRITSWNKGAERIFGYTAEEAIGQSITMLIPPDRLSEEEGILGKLQQGERIDHFETVRVKKNGTQIDVSLTISPVKDAVGRIIGASKIARDLTENQRAKILLEEERAALETVNQVGRLLSAELDLEKLVQALTDAATKVIDAQFGAFFYNELDESGASYLLLAWSGTPREQFLNFPSPRATELFGATFRGEGVIRVDDVRQDPRYGKNPPYHEIPAGHLPVVSYLAVPVISRSGEIFGGIFFGHSEPGMFSERHEQIVTGLAGQAAIAMENARLYETARRARKEAEEANRMKDEFLATVSHELRTPLNAILGWSRMLRGGRLNEQSITHAVETIERNARAQAQIIEDILDVSRIITGKVRLDVNRVEIGSTIEAAVDSLRPAAEARGVRLQTVLDGGPNLVLGDSSRLQQVIWNLLSNAIKFTPKEGRVQVVLERINSHIEIKVVDTGQGISPEFLPFVFERFRQADSSTAREYSGLGLGLAIVRHLVELHGGSVSADSGGLGCGATFTVKLPLAALRESGRPPEQSSLRLHSQAPESGTPMEFRSELAGLRVLTVDDEPDVRDLLTVILQQYGAEVRAAGSTAEALEVLQEWRPDVMVSDIGMPVRDGYDLIQEVRRLSSEAGGDTPAIALTAYARSEDRLKALRSGFQTHVAKPIEPAELAAIIASIARTHGRPR
ncbi:MAG TPA: GAF domain-containing protein [Blastocatellia bacterium]|nr:GAF domain-containing protein [Blastocatellia bacterium]